MKKTILFQLFLLLVTYSYSQEIQRIDLLLNTNYSYIKIRSIDIRPTVGDFGFEVGAQAKFKFRNSEKMKILLGTSLQYSNWTVTAFNSTNEQRLLHLKESVQLGYPLSDKLKVNSGIWIAYLAMADYQEAFTNDKNDRFWFRKFPFGGMIEMDYQIKNNLIIYADYSISATSIYARSGRDGAVGGSFKKARLNLFKLGVKYQIQK